MRGQTARQKTKGDSSCRHPQDLEKNSLPCPTAEVGLMPLTISPSYKSTRQNWPVNPPGGCPGTTVRQYRPWNERGSRLVHEYRADHRQAEMVSDGRSAAPRCAVVCQQSHEKAQERPCAGGAH